MFGRIGRAIAVAGVLAFALALGWHPGSLWPSMPHEESTPGLLALSFPAFAQAAKVDEFPYSEAGICAYVDMKQAIDLTRSGPVFSGVEASELEYMIGTVELPNLPEHMWPHLYISRDGWMMAYYPRTDPTSRVVQWVGYQQGDMTTTTLRDALVQATQKIGLSTAAVISSMGYYHFQYPNATRLLVAVDTTTGTDTFTYTIPSGLNLYEASWSHRAASVDYYGSYTDVDSVRLGSGGEGTYVVCGALQTQFLTPESAHMVTVYCRNGWAGTAIVFLYQ
ncbi:MAG: hypothetical protein ABFD77_08865 [Thermotogota bacterium]